MRTSIFFFCLFFAQLQTGVQQTQNENQLAPVINDLSVVARLINGISVQSDLMRSSKNQNAIVGDLLGIGESIQELLKLNVKDLMKDVEGLLEDVKAVPKLTDERPEALREAVKLMKSVDVKELRSAEKVKLDDDVKANWTEAMKTPSFVELKNSEFLAGIMNLHQIVKTKLPDDQLGQEALLEEFRRFANRTGIIRTTFEKLLSELSDDSGIWKVIDTKQAFSQFLPIAKVAQKFVDHFPSFQSLRADIEELKYTVPKMDSILKRRSSTDVWDILEKITSSDKITDSDKTLTAGFHNGISDLKKLMIDDLNGKWLQESIGAGNDMKLLITALEPLQKFYENLKPLETSWSKFKQNQKSTEVIGNVSRILRNAKIVEGDKLIRNVAADSGCVSGLQDIVQKAAPERFHKFYSLLDHFEAQVNAFKPAALGYINSPVAKLVEQFQSNMFDILEFPVSKSDYQRELDKVLKLPNINQLSAAMTKFAESVKNIDFEVINKMKAVWSYAFEVQEIFKGTKFLDVIECLNKQKFDFNGAEAFSQMQIDVDALKDQTDVPGSIKVFEEAIDSLIRVDKELKMRRRRRRRSLKPEAKKLLELADSVKLARNLGNGVEVLREMSEVFENQEKVLKIASVEESVDTVIQLVPEMKGQWTLENKKALKDLVNDLNKLNKDVSKNRSLESIWKQFGAAQDVNGAPIESRILATFVFKVLEKSSESNVSAAAPVFKDFPPLQLDFTGQKRVYLREALKTLDPITVFFKDFFKLQSSTSSTSGELFDYLPVIIGLLTPVLLAGLAAGVIYLFMKNRRKQQKDNLEPRLIYIAFLREDEEETLVEAMDSCAHRLSHGMVVHGSWINQYGRVENKYTTPMHIAVEHTDEVLLQFLIESGGDPWMESSERETTLDVLARIWSRDNRRGDPNEKKLESKTRIFALLEQHWKTKPNHHQEPPPPLPFYNFSFLLPADQCQAFRNVLPDRVCAPGAFNVKTTTHAVVKVNWKGIAHIDEKQMNFYFKAIFSPAILVSMKYIDLITKDSDKHGSKDYDYRVKMVAFKGIIYKNVDEIKRFARRRHIPFGAGIYLCLISSDKELKGVIENLGFIVVSDVSAMQEGNSYYRGRTKNYVVSDGTAPAEEIVEKMKGVTKDKYNAMSLEQFTVHLLAMQITGKDGGKKLFEDRVAAEFKETMADKKARAKVEEKRTQKVMEEVRKEAEKEKKIVERMKKEKK